MLCGTRVASAVAICLLRGILDLANYKQCFSGLLVSIGESYYTATVELYSALVVECAVSPVVVL